MISTSFPGTECDNPKCMTFARMVLQSSEIPAATSFRASDDYGPGQTGYYPHVNDPTGDKGCSFPYCVYYVGTTSILAYATQLEPSKDNYWSTPVQPGSAFNHGKYPSFYNDTIKPYNEMQGAISAYTAAMVAPSDGIGYSNATVLADQDGVQRGRTASCCSPVPLHGQSTPRSPYQTGPSPASRMCMRSWRRTRRCRGPSGPTS